MSTSKNAMEQSPEGVPTTRKDAHLRQQLLPMGLLVMLVGVGVAAAGVLTISYEVGQQALQLRGKNMDVTVGGAAAGRAQSLGEVFFTVPFTHLGETTVTLTLLGQGMQHLSWAGALLAVGMFLIRARHYLFDRSALRWLTIATACALVGTPVGAALLSTGTFMALGELGLPDARAAGHPLSIWGGILAAYILICLRVAIAVGAAQQDELSAVV